MLGVGKWALEWRLAQEGAVLGRAAAAWNLQGRMFLYRFLLLFSGRCPSSRWCKFFTSCFCKL